MFVQVFLGDFGSDVPHDDRVFRLVVVRLIGQQHKQPFAAVVQLILLHDDVPIGCVDHPQEGRNRPLRALLLPQKVHRLDRGEPLKVRLQVLLAAGGGDVLHVDQLLPVHFSRFGSEITVVGNMADDDDDDGDWKSTTFHYLPLTLLHSKPTANCRNRCGTGSTRVFSWNIGIISHKYR